MANAVVRLGYLTVAQFAANPTLVLEHGQHVYLSDGADEFIDAYVIGDGITQLSILPWKGLKGVQGVTGSGVDNTDPHNPVINIVPSIPAEEVFTNEPGMSHNIILSTTPSYVQLFNTEGRKLTTGTDYTITTNTIAFLYEFLEPQTITVIKYQ